MSNLDELHNLFNSDFDYDHFIKTVLNPLENNVGAKPQQKTNDLKLTEDSIKNNHSIKHFYHKLHYTLFGNIRQFDIYEVILDKNTDIRRNRRCFQTILHQETFKSRASFLLIHYENTEGRAWRFSYVTKNENSTKRFTYVFGKGHPTRTAIQQFSNLFKTTTKSLSEKDLTGAFAIEPLTDEFYKGRDSGLPTGKTKEKKEKLAFKDWEKLYQKQSHDFGYYQWYQLFQSYIIEYKKDPNKFGTLFTTCDDKTIRNYVKKLFGRIIFLFFLQKKGWMGCKALKNSKKTDWTSGNRNFMQELFQTYLHDPDHYTYLKTLDDKTTSEKKGFLDAVLEPLFFECLNEDRRKENDTFRPKESIIYNEGAFASLRFPYLNGGLFKCDPLDTPVSRFPDDYFQKLFSFFDEYNFTIDENSSSDVEIGVDPEMLGKIFEGLLEDNKDKGAYYTPKPIVEYMCKESLIAHLTTDIEDEKEKKLCHIFLDSEQCPKEITSNRDLLFRILRKLDHLKICDPAIGSGAFPMELLRILVQVKAQLGEAARKYLLDDVTQYIKANSPHAERILPPFTNLIQAASDNEKGSLLPSLASAGAELRHLLDKFQAEFDTQSDLCDAILDEMRLLCDANNRTILPSRLQPLSSEALKRTILKNNIYGVDIDSGAVDIARLRFWLSIVVDADTPEPLPNLDFKIMQGNSLLESYNGYDLSRISTGAAEKISESQAKTKGKKKKTDAEQVQPELFLDVRNTTYFPKNDNPVICQQINDKCKQYFVPNDHEHQRNLLIEIKNLIKDLLYSANIDLKDINPMTNDQFFLWHVWFKDVFDKGGFDIVIGNPPYGILKSTNPFKTLYISIYEFIKTKTAQSKNIWPCFIEQAILRLMNAHGILSYIVPEGMYKTLSYSECISTMNNYGSTILKSYFSDRIFKNAGVVTGSVVFVYKKNEFETTCIDMVDFKIISDIFVDSTSILLGKIRNSSILLKDLCNLYKGMCIDTSCKNLIFDNKSSIDASDILLYGSCINKWTIKKLYYTDYDKLIFTGGTTKKYKYEIYPRILIRRTGDELCCAIIEKACLNESTLFSCYPKTNDTNIYYILALLNSNLLNFYNKNVNITNQKGYPQIQQNALESLPIKFGNEYQTSSLIKLTKQLLTSLNASVENELNKIIYDIYDLDDNERRLIDPNYKPIIKPNDDSI